jgi:hypothetical protein
MDDYDCTNHPFNIRGFWDGYSLRYNLTQYDVNFPNPFHDIKVVTNKWEPEYDENKKWYCYNKLKK